MNERIRQLYYECQDESQSTEQCYQKFAELIVQECVDKINKNMPNSEQTDLAYNAMLVAIIADVYESFGIQERKSERFNSSFESAFKNGVDLSGQETP
jgi:hypothetical protein